MASRASSPDVLSHVQELLEAFTAFDSDDDGLVSAAELAGILSSMGYNATEEEVTGMMREADVDGDGQLSLEEFLEMSLKNVDLGSLAGLLRSALEMLDAAADDGGDEIDGVMLYELVNGLGSGVTKEQCEALIAALDVDGDGMVGLDDFKTIANALL
ncbi:probable calcium-binding protein CML29 [Nymphaea colorata]|uniref:EF-hand domain-containing protein n=1 Tax=Nymphaea colorata TaxID=210225 RepID=A0A5K0X311_9MAGN|nr:probable calcium-binding protein CML29 [Nymphaea colorata]